VLKLVGSINISGDKSISHRALIISAMSIGKTRITNLLESDDVMRTLKILRELGVKIIKDGDYWLVYGNGTNGFVEPDKPLNCGNSGTTARLMIGAVSSNPINCSFIGDNSLSKRSMSRVTKYLEKIGAVVQLTKKDYLPLFISGNDKLLPMTHKIQKASAQIKSALILAALNIHGRTKIIEKTPTRDHTERLLKFLNVNFHIKKIKNKSNQIELNGPCEIKSKNIEVAGDPSSASFFIVGALIIPKSKITLKNVMLNPSRTAFLKVLKSMGGKLKIKKTKKVCGEEVGNITVEYSNLKGVNIPSSQSAFLIDEYPILSIAASQAFGKTTMRGLDELRHKESDRINSIIYNLKKVGIDIYEKNNNLFIHGNKIKVKKNTQIKSFNDHRIAMSFSILNVLFQNKLKIDNKKCISISYPDFQKHLNYLSKKTYV
jgi:3-phosphoshikimate 1-carboxyvinyltransferase